MKKEYLPKLTELIAAMAATFNREVDEAMFLGYEMALSDLSIEAIQTAVQMALRSCKFMPTGAELRELAGDVSPKERAAVALGVVDLAIKTDGYYRSVNFDDPLVNATIRSLGGWEHASTLEGEFAINQWRRDFKDTYVAFCKAGVGRQACGPLLGLYDRQNGFNGHERKEPLLIECGLAPHPDGLVRLPGKSVAKLTGVQLKLKGPE
jgi:hypothetical protein